jgi:hypothetical protein
MDKVELKDESPNIANAVLGAVKNFTRLLKNYGQFFRLTKQ